MQAAVAATLGKGMKVSGRMAGLTLGKGATAGGLTLGKGIMVGVTKFGKGMMIALGKGMRIPLHPWILHLWVVMGLTTLVKGKKKMLPALATEEGGGGEGGGGTKVQALKGL